MVVKNLSFDRQPVYTNILIILKMSAFILDDNGHDTISAGWVVSYISRENELERTIC